MSQSKIPATDGTEKKFVIKHVFKNFINVKQGETVHGPVEYHFNIPWKIRVPTKVGSYDIFLDCMEPTDKEWSITTHILREIVEKNGNIYNYEGVFERCTLRNNVPYYYFGGIGFGDIRDVIYGTDLVVKLTVIIREATGLEFFDKKFRNFDVEEESDVTLIVKDQKFRVCKMYLAAQSSYFKTLFSGNFAESQKSEIELKDIDPNDFQHYLEFLYAESSIEAHSVLGILRLADFFDSKTAIRRCQKFLIQNSNLPLNQKLEVAIKYNLEELKTKCISEMSSAADLKSIVPKKSDNLKTKD